MLKNKIGEITTQQIVMLIILIVSFAVILIFIFVLNPGKLTDQQICHNSVILVDKGEGLVGNLDCRTGYTCISGGGNCPDLASKQTKVKIDLKNDINDKKKIVESLAEEMSNCWWEFGEGKIDYVGNAVAFSDNICAVCSVVSFDKEVQALGSVTYQELYEGMNKLKDGRQTYLKYLYNTGNLVDFTNNLDVGNIKGEDYLQRTIDFSKEYVVVTGLSEERVFGLLGGGNYIPVLILEKDKQSYEDLGCDEFLTKA